MCTSTPAGPTRATTPTPRRSLARCPLSPIHSDDLGAALAAITLSPAVTAKFTSDQRYLCARMGTQAPFLPVHGEEEGKLFDLRL